MEGVVALQRGHNPLNADFILRKHELIQLQLRLEVSEEILGVNADFEACKEATIEAYKRQNMPSDMLR
jgi:hypothetical protein